jgi:hypothetical protein
LFEGFGKPVSFWRRVAGCRTRVDKGGIDGSAPSPTKGALVEFDGDAVQFDRPLESVGGQRNRSALIGKAEHEKIARDRISEEAAGNAGGVDEFGIICSGRLGNAALQFSAGKCEIGVSCEVAGDGLVAVDDRSAVGGLQL